MGVVVDACTIFRKKVDACTIFTPHIRRPDGWYTNLGLRNSDWSSGPNGKQNPHPSDSV